ncbi:AMP-binding protein [Stappia taiwanensis]|uniref:AMP-binding protein n=1 Tax=Stappia taiwanensis TaxID=992267 RepID=A0A838XZD2_9HYPH|nr:AMP-binding protein [Stappia taiwanensis]MBA4612364.1 AMP-binding protein [Stappia taiwanensis]GGF04800.1 phenylacetate--CoA ligase [Stappia taiwanensis]
MSAEHFDQLEIQDPDAREADLFARLPAQIAYAKDNAPGWAAHLAGIDAEAVSSREALAALPVLRKPELMAAQVQNPPFGGFAAGDPSAFGRIFMSPGPVWEPQGEGTDPWSCARALFAAGFRPGDVVHNALSYQLTPGGFILDLGARALGCTVFPAGAGNTEAQLDALEALRPVGYTGTPDFLKVLLDKAAETGRDASSIRKALVSGGALFPSLRAEYESRGVSVLQAYATADLGVIAYESMADEGLIVSENMIAEIVRPGTDCPVPEGEVGELVVTCFSRSYPLIRFGTGDLSAVVSGRSSCGRTNMRLKGWMGRADQRTKVKGMFVDPKQVAAVLARHPEVARARLIVEREQDRDVMRLAYEVAGDVPADLGAALSTSLREITKLGGAVELVAPGSLPNDGKIISDERNYDS